MNFLNKTLQSDERPVYRSRLHGIYVVSGFLWFAALAGAGWAFDLIVWERFGAFIPPYFIDNQYIRFGIEPGWIGWMLTFGGAYILLGEIIDVFSTHVVITTRRLIYKTGFLRVRVSATEISDILGARVDQGWFGQFFGYGRLHLDCRFIEDIYIPYVRNPYGVSESIEKVRRADVRQHASRSGVAPAAAATGPAERPVSQTLIQITGNNPVYIVDHVPADPKTPLRQLPKSLGDNMKNAFRRKA